MLSCPTSAGETNHPMSVRRAILAVLLLLGAACNPPSHVIKGAKSTDQIPLDRFYGKARLIDFRMKPKDQPLTVSDFQDKGIQSGDIVIAFVGYTPPAADSLPSYAYLSGEAAEWLAKLPIKAFATDRPMRAAALVY
jgi:arylformamidase